MTSQKRIYLDHNATAPLRPEAHEAMLEALGAPANASSIHQEGRRAKRIIENAREQVAKLVNGDPEAIIFTSGATEAINMICRPLGYEMFRPLVTEHAAVLAGHGFNADKLEPILVNKAGEADWLGVVPKAEDLIAVQAANSETGVIQPQRLAEEDEPAFRYFSDCVQAAGKMPIDMTQIGANLICISSHKLGGPQGAAAIIGKTTADLPATLIAGGGQEKGKRGGTQNVAAIAGFGAAAEASLQQMDEFCNKTSSLRDEFETQLMALVGKLGAQIVVHGQGAERLTNTSCFSILGVDAATALMVFDLAGVAISSGSACSSGKVGKSHVLTAMGVADAEARAALRLSFGWDSEASDVDHAIATFKRELPRLIS